jgi:hypothetical protein
MPDLLIDFIIRLENEELHFALHPHHGPLFHKWLPEGKNDSIQLETDDPTNLQVWFERRGFSEGVNDFIRFHPDRKEADPNIISRQAVLVGGALFGELTIPNIDETTVQSLQLPESDNADYVALGKKIIKIIYPPVSRFIELLRIVYGQYWIPQIEKWDSRGQSLGSYCSSWQMRWSSDNGNSWHEFIPDERVTRTFISMEGYEFGDEKFNTLIRHEDWPQLPAQLQKFSDPKINESFAVSDILLQSFQFLDQGNLRQALIEGVIALETVIGEFARRKLENDGSLKDKFQSFYTLPLPAQLIAVSTFSESCSKEQLISSLKAIELRNKIVHDGEKTFTKLKG